MYVTAYYMIVTSTKQQHTHLVGEHSPSVLKKKKMKTKMKKMKWNENSKRNGELSSVLGKETLTLKTVSAAGYDYNNDYI